MGWLSGDRKIEAAQDRSLGAIVDDAYAAVREIQTTDHADREQAILRAKALVDNAGNALLRSSTKSRSELEARMADLHRELALSVAGAAANTPNAPAGTAAAAASPLAQQQPAEQPQEVTGDIDDMDKMFTSMALSAPGDAADAAGRAGAAPSGAAAVPSPPQPGRKFFKVVRSLSGIPKATAAAQPAVARTKSTAAALAGGAPRVAEGHDTVGRREAQGAAAAAAPAGAPQADQDDEALRYKPHAPQPLRIELPELPPEVMAAAAARPAHSRGSSGSTVARRGGGAGAGGGNGNSSDSDDSITSPEYNDSTPASRKVIGS